MSDNNVLEQKVLGICTSVAVVGAAVSLVMHNKEVCKGAVDKVKSYELGKSKFFSDIRGAMLKDVKRDINMSKRDSFQILSSFGNVGVGAIIVDLPSAVTC